MEKKSIGQFIAALRKASGMTQKELSEHLHVSDKAVSRWERDENAPDLSLIPVIADLFGVTADELLRGERRPVSADREAEDKGFSAKSRKQIQYLIQKAQMTYRLQCLIVVGIGVLGILVALMINALNRALIGFFVGLSVMLVAAVCLALFTVLALFKGSGEEWDAALAGGYRQSVADTAFGVSCFLLLGYGGLVLPLSCMQDPYCGISWSGMAYLIPAYLLGSLAVCLVSSVIFLRRTLLS